MKINWTVRIKNKLFWIAIIPAALLLVNVVLELFGVSLDTTALEAQLIKIVEAIFTLLAILGVVVDNTTDGIGDSKQALTYTEPKK